MEVMLEKLNDIDINVHGFTQQDVIDGRIARNELIREGALRGDRIYLMSEWLHSEAKAMGIDVTYNEDLDEDDLC